MSRGEGLKGGFDGHLGRSAAFDAGAARGPTREVPLHAVLDLLPLSHAPERVAQYREAMRSGSRFPPVSVLRLGGRYVIADGHKRFSAYAELGQPTILVELWGPGRFLLDQARQVRDNARKNRAILGLALRDRREAARLARATLEHWLRVARSLAHLASRPRG